MISRIFDLMQLSSAVLWKCGQSHWYFRRSFVSNITLKRIRKIEKVVNVLLHLYSISIFNHILMMNGYASNERILHINGSNLYSTLALYAFRYRYTANTDTHDKRTRQVCTTAHHIWIEFNSASKQHHPYENPMRTAQVMTIALYFHLYRILRC